MDKKHVMGQFLNWGSKQKNFPYGSISYWVALFLENKTEEEYWRTIGSGDE